MNLKARNQTKTKLNSDNTHPIGCSVTKGNIYIGHICLKNDTGIEYYLENTLGFLLNTWKVPFQAHPINCS